MDSFASQQILELYGSSILSKCMIHRLEHKQQKRGVANATVDLDKQTKRRCQSSESQAS